MENFWTDMVVFLFGIRLMNVIAENPFFSFIYFYKASIIYFLIFVVQFQITWDAILDQTRSDCNEIFWPKTMYDGAR